jgi:hypothetical protein
VLKGGHLLNHDDVISTRAVSFIIYLTDPDEPWTAEDGGALELYPLVEGERRGGGGGGGNRGGGTLWVGGVGGGFFAVLSIPVVPPMVCEAQHSSCEEFYGLHVGGE